MADGTPDFADLLAAFDDPPALVQGGHGTSRPGLQSHNIHAQPSYGSVDGIQHHLNQQIGADNTFSQISNPVFNNSIPLQQISAQRPAPNVASQNLRNVGTTGNLASEEESFGGGSLGSMFLSSVESLLSDEGSTPYTVKVNQSAQVQKRPRQRQKPAATIHPRVQANRVTQNTNTNSSITLSSFSKNDVISNFPQQQQNHGANPSNNAAVKIGQASPASFVSPAELQMQNNTSALGGQQKVYSQNQFAVPSPGVRQQAFQAQTPNPPRPLSAASTTSDHASRPGSVPQPSPSCGSNHSGDPATPLTPQSYNQNYSAGTPGQPLTPQQNMGISQMSPQMPSQVNMMSNDRLISGQDGRFSSHQSPMKSHNKSGDSLSELPTPIKEAILSDTSSIGSNSQSQFQNQTVSNERNLTQGDNMWIQSGTSTFGLHQNQGLSDLLFSESTQAKSIMASTYQSPSLPSQMQQSMSYASFGMMPQSIFDNSNDSAFMSTESLTQNQSKLLEQMASQGRTKRKSLELTGQQASMPASNSSSFSTSVDSDLSLKQQAERNTTIDMMNKASDTGVATVKELFNPPTACYEAISPVSDIAMSPVSKTNLTEDLSESSLYSTAKFPLHKQDLLSDHSMTQRNNPVTDPVLMYLKHDTVTQTSANAAASNSTTYSSNMLLPNSFLGSHNTSGPMFPSTTQNDLSNQFLNISATVNQNSQTFPNFSRSIDLNQGFSTGISGNSFNMSALHQPAQDSTISNKSWQPLPTVSTAKTQGSGLPSVYTSEAATKVDTKKAIPVDFQAHLDKRDEKSISSKSPKSGAFGVSKRRSSKEVSKTNTSKSKSGKSNSFDADFGFGSDEPTIRLANKVPTANPQKPGSVGSGTTQASKIESSLLSPKTRVNVYPPQKMGDDVKDAMDELKQLQQQQAMLLKMQKYQAQQSQQSVQPNKQPTINLSSSSNVHYQLPTLSNPSTVSRHQTTLVEEQRPKPTFSATPASNSVLVSQSLNGKILVNQTSRLPSTTVEKATTTASMVVNTQSHTVSYQPTTTVESMQQQHSLHFPSSMNVPNPYGFHQTSSSLPQFSNPVVNQFLNMPQSVPSSYGMLPPFHNANAFVPPTAKQHEPPLSNVAPMASTFDFLNKTALSSTTTNVTSSTSSSTSSAIHHDLGWLHQEVDKYTYKSSTPTTTAPPLITSTSQQLQNIYSPSTMSISPSPSSTSSSFYSLHKPELLLSPADHPKQVIHNVIPEVLPNLNRKAPAVIIPATSISVTKEPAPVHHETKHHYGKKHRILEGSYPSSTEVYKFGHHSGPNHAGSVATSTNTTAEPVSDNLACSVLDKQRRYSKDHKTVKQHNHGQIFGHDLKKVQDNAMENRLLANLRSTPQTLPPMAPKALDGTISDLSKVSNANAIDLRTSVMPTPRPAPVSKPKDVTPVKDDQTGSMLSLFNSLLQEASKSAADNLKTKQTSSPTPPEKNATPKSTDPPSSQASKEIEETKAKTTTVPSTLVTQTVSQIRPAPIPVSLEKKVVKQIRPAATVPFKRRPYPAISDFETPKISFPNIPKVSTSSVATSASSIKTTPIAVLSAPVSSSNSSKPTAKTKHVGASNKPFTLNKTTSSSKSNAASKPIVTSKPTAVSKPVVTSKSDVALNKPIEISKPLKTSNPVASQSPVLPATPTKATTTLKHAVTSTQPTNVTTTLNTVPTPLPLNKQSPVKSGSLPKLRITAFRSSAGQVIHQASVVTPGTVNEEAPRKHPKRKKKKKKRKRHLSPTTSDYDSSVSSVTSMSSHEPSNVLQQNEPKVEPLQKAEAKVEVPLKQPESSPVTNENKKLPKKQKRGTSSVNSEASSKKQSTSTKRAKVSKEPTNRKSDKRKEKFEGPIARYQPTSVLQASSGNVISTSTSAKIPLTLPNTFQRAPGKPPMYMNTSESKSNSGSVPTIQLVARNTKLLETNLQSKTTTPQKIVSVKLSNSLSSKTFPTQILSTSAVQYLMPSQQRLILPNLSSSVTVPVSLMSSLVSRTSGTTLLPVPISPITTSSPLINKAPLIVIHQSSGGKTVPSSMVFAPLKSPILTTSITKSLAASEVQRLASKAKTITTTTAPATVITSKISASAISSNSDANSFQSTFSKLISNQNPVPVYSPPSPPTHLKMEDETKKHHQCLECRDSFMFQGSLEDHYERRSILIKVWCMQCNKNLAFLNKCKLLMHARQHSDKGNGMQFNNAHISPIPLSMCKPRSRESFLSPSSATSSRRRSTLSSEDERGHSFQSYGHEPTMTCTDCNFSASSPEALEEHFQQQTQPDPSESGGNTKQTSNNFTCDMCNLTLFNQCSFNAHMRMHKKVAPHTCPECGQTFDFDGKEMDFNLHLSIQCFHLSRMSCYKCRLCSSIFKNGDLLRRHLEVRHLQTFYKCRDCPMAFKTQENITSHQRSTHGVVAATKTIHKCPLCDTVFTDNSPTQQLFLLQKHFEGHINHPSINITAYKCLFCSNIYERKSLLRDHLKTAHDVTSPGDSGSDLPPDISDAELLLDANHKKKPNENTTSLKKGTSKKRLSVDSLGSKETSSKVAKLSSGPKRNEEINANALIASGSLSGIEGITKKSTLGGNHISNKLLNVGNSSVKHSRQPLKLRLKGMKSHLSNSLSSTKLQLNASSDSMKESSGRSDHVIGSVGGFITDKDGKKIFPCNECRKEFLSSHSRLNHIRSKHRGIRNVYCCPHCPIDKIKFAKRISLVKHLKKVHKIAEITKQDIRMVSAHVPPMPAGQRFDASSVTIEENGEKSGDCSVHMKAITGSPDSHKHVRKKITALGRKNGREQGARPMRQVRLRAESRCSSLGMSSSDDEKTESKDTEDVELDESAFASLRFPDSYTCAKCSYESSDRLKFQAHIVEHREDDELAFNLGSMQQCTECGLCFASIASHNKHLFIKHKIKKKKLLQKYDEKLRTERAAAGDLPKSLMDGTGAIVTGENGGKKHKCSVCFRRFDEEGTLRTHMRTHGLAFVKSKHIS